MLYNKEQVKGIIPHRPPFLFIDGVASAEGGRVEAWYGVTGEEAFFAGHFPGYPVMPGVLVLEAIAQAGAVALLSAEEFRGKLALFAGAENVRWRREVKPGDRLTLKVALEGVRMGMGRGSGEAWVGEELACSAVIKFAVKK